MPPNPVMLTQGEMKTMTKGSAWMLTDAVVSFAGPAAASPETGARRAPVREWRLRGGESTD